MPEGKTDGYIELHSGARYYPSAEVVNVDVNDIAHALGNQCRYTGHCRHFYSVAEHSVLCSLLAEELKLCSPFEALMHDAHEALICDLAAPIKPYVPDYKALEKRASTALREAYGLSTETSEGCNQIDYIALFLEAYFLMHSKAEGWYDPHGLRIKALKLINSGWKLAGLEPVQAKNAFLRRYKELMKEKHNNAWWVEQDMDSNWIRDNS